jgi:hypothetical protein
MKYYFDTCIWRDYLENRSDNLRPLGEWALGLIKKIIEEDSTIIFSDFTEDELLKKWTKGELKDELSFIPEQTFLRIKVSQKQIEESFKLSRQLKIHPEDVFHAIVARDDDAILVTRDKHFIELTNVVIVRKPEDLI